MRTAVYGEAPKWGDIEPDAAPSAFGSAFPRQEEGADPSSEAHMTDLLGLADELGHVVMSETLDEARHAALTELAAAAIAA